MKIVLMRVAVLVLNLIYTIFSPFKLRNKITILSRQSNKRSVDIRLLEKSLDEKKIETVVLAKRLNKSVSGGVKYAFHMLRQMYHISTSKVIVIDGYCILVSVLNKKEGQKVVQIWHSLGAIKKFGYQSVGKENGNRKEVAEVMKLHRNYDYVIAPGEITAEIYRKAFDIAREKVMILGLPRIDYLMQEDNSLKEKISEEYHISKTKKKILYLPTFRKGEEFDIREFVENFPYDKYDLIIKRHWLDKSDYMWTSIYGAILIRNENTLDLIKFADKVITDYSAAAFEAAVLGKELYFYVPDIGEYEKKVGINIDVFREDIAPYVYKDACKLIKSLDKKYDRKCVEAFRDKYIDIGYKHCTDKLSEFLVSLMKKGILLKDMVENV